VSPFLIPAESNAPDEKQMGKMSAKSNKDEFKKVGANKTPKQKKAAAPKTTETEEIIIDDFGFDIDGLDQPQPSSYGSDQLSEEDLQNFKSRNFRDVPDYRALRAEIEALEGKAALNAEEQAALTAQQSTMALMERLIASIDIEDDATILDFGTEAFRDLDLVSADVLRKAERDGLFVSELTGIEDAVGDLNWEKFNANAEQWIKLQGVNAKEQAGGLLGTLYKGPLGGFLAGAGVEQARKTREINKVLEGGIISDQEIEEDLRKASIKLHKLRIMLNEADYKIPFEMKNLEKLARARLKAYQKISVYIGAANEKLRRVAESDLAQAQQKVAAKDSWIEQQKLEDAMRAFNKLDERITDMEISRAIFISSTQALKQLKDEYEVAHDKVKYHKEESLPHWSATLKQVAQVLRLTELEDAIQDAENLAEKMMKQHEAANNNVVSQVQSGKAQEQEMEKALKSVQERARQIELLAEHTARLKDSKSAVEGKLLESLDGILLSRAESLSRRVSKLEDKRDAATGKDEFRKAAEAEADSEIEDALNNQEPKQEQQKPPLRPPNAP